MLNLPAREEKSHFSVRHYSKPNNSHKEVFGRLESQFETLPRVKAKEKNRLRDTTIKSRAGRLIVFYSASSSRMDASYERLDQINQRARRDIEGLCYENHLNLPAGTKKITTFFSMSRFLLRVIFGRQES